MLDKFYAQHKIFYYKTVKSANSRHVFGVAELLLDIYNVKDSDSPHAQKGPQKHYMYLSKFVNLLKNSTASFLKVMLIQKEF